MPACLISPKIAAQRCAVTTRTIRNWIRDGKLTGYKLGGSWRLDPIEVTRFIKAGERRCLSTNVGMSGGYDLSTVGKKSDDRLDHAINAALSALKGN